MYSSLPVITPASGQAVSNADLLAQLRNTDASESTLLTAYILAATELYQKHTQEILLTTGFRLNLDNFPGQSYLFHNLTDHASYRLPNYQPANQIIYLPVYPVAVITSVEYLDPTNTWQVLAGTSTDTDSRPSRVILPASLPVLHASIKPNVRVNFTAGYGDNTQVPPLPALLIKLIATHWYEQRAAFGTAEMKEIPLGYSAICAQRSLNLLTDWNK